MPPETPTTTTRPRSMTSLLSLFFVEERDFAADRALERRRRDLAGHVLAGAARPLVDATRLARGNDRDLVLVGSGRGNHGSQLGHRALLLLGIGARAQPAHARPFGIENRDQRRDRVFEMVVQHQVIVLAILR